MKISLFKKIKLFFVYRNIIRGIQRELQVDFNARVDNVSRIYTVLNVPSELIEEPYNLRKSDIDAMSSNFIREYSSQLSKFLDTKGLSELYDFYEIEKVEKYSYLLIFGFSLFDSQKFFRNIYFFLVPSLIVILLGIIFYFTH